jgi:hypothetical protein
VVRSYQRLSLVINEHQLDDINALRGGLLNCYFWLDPVKRVTGALFTQVLPFFDPEVLKLDAAFERGVYGV